MPSEDLAQKMMDFLCLLRGRGVSRPDGPHRLVRHHRLVKAFNARDIDNGIDLSCDHGFG